VGQEKSRGRHSAEAVNQTIPDGKDAIAQKATAQEGAGGDSAEEDDTGRYTIGPEVGLGPLEEVHT
jgi:hypothetical protein